jgi:hypothetical protein
MSKAKENGKPQGFDIGSKRGVVTAREDDGVEVHVRDELGEYQFYEENGEQKPVVICMAGTYSSVYRKALAKQRDRAMKQRRASVSGEELHKRQLELIAECVLWWKGFVDGGKPYPHNVTNAVALFEVAPWIREDCESAMGDHESFFSKGSPS